MTNNQLTDERLTKILSETQATIMQHNSRQVRGSVEVDARLFEAVLIEAQLYRIGSNRLGIAAAAKWVDQQREAFDNEHGQYDRDTGVFEFGNDAQSEYSATLAELAEGIRSLHPNPILEPLIEQERVELQERHKSDALPAPHPSKMSCIMPDYEGVAMTQRECYMAGKEAGLAEARKSPVIPDGYALVPVEPTAFMRKAFHKANDEADSFVSPDHQWSAMLAAAPKLEKI